MGPHNHLLILGRGAGTDPRGRLRKGGRLGQVKHLGDPNSERRGSPRVFLDLEVDYRCEDTFLYAYMTDLSAMGIFVRTNYPQPRGTRLNLRFTPPGDEEPLEMDGEVAWVNAFRPGDFNNLHPGMGVRFVSLDKSTRCRLKALVRKIAYLERLPV